MYDVQGLKVCVRVCLRVFEVWYHVQFALTFITLHLSVPPSSFRPSVYPFPSPPPLSLHNLTVSGCDGKPLHEEGLPISRNGPDRTGPDPDPNPRNGPESNGVERMMCDSYLSPGNLKCQVDGDRTH